MVSSQRQAKRFFIEKIVAQAAREGLPLSDVEHQMLSFSESDGESSTEHGIVERLEREISDKDYESKVAGLLRRSYERDVAAGSGARELYGEAHAVLAEGDYYLLVMIEQAIGGAAANGVLGALRTAGLFGLLVLPGVVALFMAVGLLLTLFGPDRRTIAGVAPIAVGALLLTAFGVYLIRLWLRERRG